MPDMSKPLGTVSPLDGSIGYLAFALKWCSSRLGKIVFLLGSCYKLVGGLNVPPLLHSTLKKHWLTLVPRGHPLRLMPCITSIQSGTCCLGWKHSVTPQVLRDMLGIARMFQQACFTAYFFIGKWSICSLLVVLKSLWSPEKSEGKGKERFYFCGPKTNGGVVVFPDRRTEMKGNLTG